MSTAIAAWFSDRRTHRYQEPPLQLVSAQPLDQVEVAPCRECGQGDSHPIHRLTT